jgi:hypothetical protein
VHEQQNLSSIVVLSIFTDTISPESIETIELLTVNQKHQKILVQIFEWGNPFAWARFVIVQRSAAIHKGTNCLFKAFEIIIVKIYSLLWVFHIAIGHLFAAEVDAPDEEGQRSLADLLFDKRREPEVNEDWLPKGRTQHDVLGLDIEMDDAQLMHQSQIPEQEIRIQVVTFHEVAGLHRELHTVLEHQQVEAKVRLHFWADLCRRGNFEDKKFSYCPVPDLRRVDRNPLYGHLLFL